MELILVNRETPIQVARRPAGLQTVSAPACVFTAGPVSLCLGLGETIGSGLAGSGTGIRLDLRHGAQLGALITFKIMTNRQLIYIVKDQKPLVLAADETVRDACRSMWERRTGSVLVVDNQERLVGIFTGRDAVRLLAKGRNAAETRLAAAMTRNPVSVTPRNSAVDALRAMTTGGFRHVPVTENEKVLGVVSRGDFKGMEFEAYRWRNISQTSSAANRTLASIIEDRKPLVLPADETVAVACRRMWQQKVGCVLVADRLQRLKGIFTGRDAVRVLAKAKDPAATRLTKAMTHDPATMPPDNHAIDALRAMNDGGFRHLPVVANGKVLGVVSRNDFTGVEIDRLDEEEHLKECIW